MAEHEDHYVVSTEYKVEDHATPVTERLKRSFKAIGHETEKLREKFREFRADQRLNAAAMLGVGFGLGAWLEKTKEVTAEFGRAKRAVAGLFTETLNWPTTVSAMDRYQASTKLAAEVTEELEETVARYGGSLDEATAGFRGLTASVAGAHLKPKQLMELYQQVAATAKATGTDVGMASEQVGRAIMAGSVRPVGVLGKELYAALHAHGKLTKAMGMTGRLKLVQEMMKDQRPIAEAMSRGIGDSMRKIQHSVDLIFKRVGTPLFAKVADLLGKWADNMMRAEHSAKPLVDAISDKLVKGFEVAKDVTTFLVDHWKEIAAIWASFKVAGMAGGAAGFLGKIGDAFGGNIGFAMKTFGGGLMNLVGKMGMLAGAITAAYEAGQVLGEMLSKKIDKHQEMKANAHEMVSAFKTLGMVEAKGTSSPMLDAAAKNAIKFLQDSGAVSNGKADRGAIITNIGKMEEADKRNLANMLGIGNKNLPVSAMAADQFADAFITKLEPLLAAHPGAIGGKKAEEAVKVDAENLKTKGIQIGPFTGNINITQKFDDVDPDRVWVATRRGIQENAERAVRSMHADPWSE